MRRTPIELPLHRRNAYNTAVLGQALYVLGAIDHPNLGELDSLAGCREPNDFLDELDTYRTCLNYGLAVHEYTSYQAELMAKDGLGYLKSYYTPWTAECDSYFTPEVVGFMQYQASHFMQTVRGLPAGRYARSLKPFAMMDILAGIGKGRAVYLTTKRPTGYLQPVLVVPPLEDENVTGWVYDPGSNNGTVSPLRLNHLWSRVDARHSAAFIGRP